jgi:protease IV
MHPTRIFPVLALVSLLFPALAAAQPVERSFATEPTGGVRLPLTPLAGEHDALSTVVNPAGLWFLRGGAFAAALDLADEDSATDTGPGLGLYSAGTLGGGVLPRTGFGVGLEFLRPPRAFLEPDPGTPLRLTIGSAIGLGRTTALGVSWHRFFDSEAPALDGLGTWDVGLSSRWGRHLAFGAVVRDLGQPTVAGVPVQRRYELELTGRPTGTEVLELAAGGRLGEIRHDLDGWLRTSWRVTRGLYLKGEVGMHTLQVLENLPSGDRDEYEERELYATVGFEISFGGLGASAFATGALFDDDARLAGGTLVVRTSAVHVPSILPPQGRIEQIELSGAIDERRLARVLLGLRTLARDEGVVAVFVQVDGLSVGWAVAQELRAELLRLRAAGKRVFSYMITGSSRDYYVASAADEVYVDPAGGIRLVGFAGTSLYFKGLFEQLGVEALFERIAEYKTAPEAYTRTGPTEPSLRMRDWLYDSLYDNIVADIARARELTPARVRALIDAGPYTGGDLAADTALVDAVLTTEEASKRIIEILGAAYPVASADPQRPQSWDLPEIAVIVIEGDIVDGRSQTIPILDRRLVGSETIARAIESARVSPHVDAIVLRINSPGGSALASEMMSREVFKTRGVKPIICSMSDLAASGGYFAAAGCDLIFAMPNTITGSIGIFYGKFDVSGLLEKLGLSWVTHTRGARADLDSFFRGYSTEERALIHEKMTYLYRRFTGAVSEGRGLTQDQVDAVGEGRVWTGTQALPRKLVDRIGGLADAIAHAKAQIGLTEDQPARILVLPVTGPSLLERILGFPGAARAAQSRPDLSWLPGGRQLLQALPGSLLHAPDAPQARLPFTIVWE